MNNPRALDDDGQKRADNRPTRIAVDTEAWEGPGTIEGIYATGVKPR